jgi:SAM-dependent methyltransferase
LNTQVSSSYPQNLPYGKPYFTSGNYTRYLCRKFRQQAEDLKKVLELTVQSTILDFGCATGGLLRAFADLGIGTAGALVGTDSDAWAIEYGRHISWEIPQIKLYHYNRNLLEEPFNVFIMLDVLEHLPTVELDTVLRLLEKHKYRKIAVRIPVSLLEGEDFLLEVSRNDKTHIQCHNKITWRELFRSHGLLIKKFLHEKSIYNSEGVLACVLE